MEAELEEFEESIDNAKETMYNDFGTWIGKNAWGKRWWWILIRDPLYCAFRAGLWWGEERQQRNPTKRAPDDLYCPACKGYTGGFICPRCDMG